MSCVEVEGSVEVGEEGGVLIGVGVIDQQWSPTRSRALHVVLLLLLLPRALEAGAAAGAGRLRRFLGSPVGCSLTKNHATAVERRIRRTSTKYVI